MESRGCCCCCSSCSPCCRVLGEAASRSRSVWAEAPTSYAYCCRPLLLPRGLVLGSRDRWPLTPRPPRCGPACQRRRYGQEAWQQHARVVSSSALPGSRIAGFTTARPPRTQSDAAAMHQPISLTAVIGVPMGVMILTSGVSRNVTCRSLLLPARSGHGTAGVDACGPPSSALPWSEPAAGCLPFEKDDRRAPPICTMTRESATPSAAHRGGKATAERRAIVSKTGVCRVLTGQRKQIGCCGLVAVRCPRDGSPPDVAIGNTCVQ